jgi:hypothetical protein
MKRPTFVIVLPACTGTGTNTGTATGRLSDAEAQALRRGLDQGAGVEDLEELGPTVADRDRQPAV